MVCGCLSNGAQPTDNGDEEDDPGNPLVRGFHDNRETIRKPDKTTIGQAGQQSFNSRSTFIHKMIDVGLLLANASQLKVLLTSEQGQFTQVNLVFVSLSMVLQALFVLSMIFIWVYEAKLEECYAEDQSNIEETKGQNNTDGAETNKEEEQKIKEEKRARRRKIKDLKRKLVLLNGIGYGLVALVIIFNILILAFGLNGDNHASSVKIGKTKYIGIVNGTLKQLN